MLQIFLMISRNLTLLLRYSQNHHVGRSLMPDTCARAWKLQLDRLRVIVHESAFSQLFSLARARLENRFEDKHED